MRTELRAIDSFPARSRLMIRPWLTKRSCQTSQALNIQSTGATLSITGSIGHFFVFLLRRLKLVSTARCSTGTGAMLCGPVHRPLSQAALHSTLLCIAYRRPWFHAPLLALLYRVYATTRKSSGEMIRKLSVIRARKRSHFLGTVRLRKRRIADLNWAKVS